MAFPRAAQRCVKHHRVLTVSLRRVGLCVMPQYLIRRYWLQAEAPEAESVPRAYAASFLPFLYGVDITVLTYNLVFLVEFVHFDLIGYQDVVCGR